MKLYAKTRELENGTVAYTLSATLPRNPDNTYTIYIDQTGFVNSEVKQADEAVSKLTGKKALFDGC